MNYLYICIVYFYFSINVFPAVLFMSFAMVFKHRKMLNKLLTSLNSSMVTYFAFGVFMKLLSFTFQNCLCAYFFYCNRRTAFMRTLFVCKESKLFAILAGMRAFSLFPSWYYLATLGNVESLDCKIVFYIY